MRGLGTVVAVLFLAAAFAARAGHEMPIYPSYYPQEIRVEPMAPAAAAPALTEGRIQAYVGAPPMFTGEPAETLLSVTSLGAFVVVDVNPASPRAQDGACAVAERVTAALNKPAADFRFHPYPVTGLHADFLHHFDRAEAARERLTGSPGGGLSGLAVRAEGTVAEGLLGAGTTAGDGTWDAAVRAIGLEDLLARRQTASNDRLGPPWLKEGWFHAVLLLADSVAQPDAKDRARALAKRLEDGAFGDAAARINAERDLLAVLTGDCKRTVAGYVLRREFYNGDFSGGVENIAYDSHAGFNSAIFVRTVKLKDFPWNGWLALGIDGTPEAAWNPVAGFTDAAGQMIWWAVGDPALFPEAYNAGWTLNRVDTLDQARKKRAKP